MDQFTISSISQVIQSDSQKYVAIIDTDIGDDIDDALALALALRSPEIELLGITTVFGDTHLRARLAAYLLSIFGRTDIPIAAGVGTPLQVRHRPSGVPQAAAIDDRIKLPTLSMLSGPELIIQTAMAHPERLTLICIGPLTNIATALQLAPTLSMAIGRIVLMGGTSGFPLPEWNVRSDARAAQIVFEAGIPITMIGMNVTLRCQLRKRDIEQLHTCNTPQTQLLSELITIWQHHHPRWQPNLPYLHDPLTITALCAPTLLQFEEMPIRVLTHGPLKGFMLPRMLHGTRARAATDIYVDEARAWIMKRLLLSR